MFKRVILPALPHSLSSSSFPHPALPSYHLSSFPLNTHTCNLSLPKSPNPGTEAAHAAVAPPGIFILAVSYCESKLPYHRSFLSNTLCHPHLYTARKHTQASRRGAAPQTSTDRRRRSSSSSSSRPARSRRRASRPESCGRICSAFARLTSLASPS